MVTLQGLRDDPFMTVAEVAKLFAVKALTVRQWIKDGELKATKFNEAFRIRESEVQRYAQLKFGETDATS